MLMGLRDMFTVLTFLTTGLSWYTVAKLSANDMVAAVPVCFVLGIFFVSRLHQILFMVLLALISMVPHAEEHRGVQLLPLH